MKQAFTETATGEDLKRERQARKLSRRALAHLCKLHPDTIRYWEKKPKLDIHGYAPRLICAALGIALPKRRRWKPRHSQSFWGFLGRDTRARGGVLHFSAKITRPATCGSKTRKGGTCQAKPVPGKRRCRFHGGLSTGPKTPEGKARIAEAQRRRWKAIR
jgi:transcriptional regulator with XRE-family HTH domain